MELELKKELLRFYEFSTVSTTVHEESTETIVPDYCPDIARIIDSDGKVFLRSKDIQGDKAIVTGSVKVTVLFTPEEETGIRNLEFVLPFNTSLSNPEFESCQSLFVKAAIQTIETKSLNPRKIFTRVLLTVQLQGLRRCTADFSSQIVSDPALGIAQMARNEELHLITSYAEKDFAFTDEIAIPSGKEAIQEILTSSVIPSVQETKIFGTKLIVKGVLLTELLYRTEQQGIASAAAELPFSQILEIEETPEDADAAVTLQLSGMDYHIGSDENPDDRHRVTVAVYLMAQACMRCQVTAHCICDVYSTVYNVSPRMETLQCTGKVSAVHCRQSVRQVVEVGVVPSAVLSAAVHFDEVAVSREENTAVLQTMAHVKLLFLDEGGVPLIAERQIECSCRAEVPADCGCSARVRYGGDLSTALSSGGIEVRFTADFAAESAERRQLLGLTELSVDTEHPKDTSQLPSIVLKVFDEEESLWEIAKQYSTTTEVIRAANDLAEDCGCAAGQMLLIPRKR